MQLTVHDHWLLQTFPQENAGERSEAEKGLPPHMLDALDRARRIQATQDPMAAAEREVIEAAEAWYDSCYSAKARRPIILAVRGLRRLRAAAGDQK